MTPEVGKVVVVFKTHLDVGFTDYAWRVQERYHEVFIPRAINLAKQIREEGSDISFVWTTGSWLIHEALECCRGRRLKMLERAIEEGDIAWHGLPFTTHCELMEASLFRFGLSLSEKLDRRFGKTTVSAKMTDVPGHTRSIVPQLADAGIRFLHIGVNPASTRPRIPDGYVWRHSDDSEVLVVYGGNSYGGTTVLPGVSTGLAVVHSNDNHGPPGAAEVEESFRGLRQAFPRAEVVSGRLDDFAVDLDAVRNNLPVVTDEIGDTWIHGVGTDPAKVSGFLELQRLGTLWENAPEGGPDPESFDAFRRVLLLIPEHTWGMDEKTFLDDYRHYTAADLEKLRRTEVCIRFERSWQEQRRYLDQALGLLKDPQRRQAREALDSLVPQYPDRRGYERIGHPGMIFSTPLMTIGFDEETGAICHMRERTSRRLWATRPHPLASYLYETFSAEDYNRFGRQYVRAWPGAEAWARKDFTKPGLEALDIPHQTVAPILDALWYRTDEAGDAWFILEMTMPEGAVRDFGAPAQLTTQVHVQAGAPEIDLVFQWFRKKACRIPEASWLSFLPRSGHRPAWAFRKMGSWISPTQVVWNGNRKLHALEEARYRDDRGGMTIVPLDSPLAAPGERSLLDFNNRQPLRTKGVHFNLHNNVWGTNFPMWYEEDGRFRFTINVGDVTL
ncbi:protein of unknown function [Alkalispirochaeta americana]|uniref:Glycosyl hydrolases family 38 N-terminal domain-containing protein n=1 Tax=Alkalispirochaeta americana TaxID=159291 RepID=A0A1N6PXU2_9SPIO|nr:DUF5054 domain-containing protein [Alkalispirochaeta americana]SIQ09107.1 protein of unknown function [Alkalispirochaeta americana]